MSPRTAKGLKWFRWVAIAAAIGFGAKAIMSISMGAHLINTLAANLAQFVGGVLLWGGLAFVFGWLFGKEKDDERNN